MIRSIIELQAWLRHHNIDPGEVLVTIEFPGPDTAARVSRHLLKDAGVGFPTLIDGPAQARRICGIDVKITARV